MLGSGLRLTCDAGGLNITALRLVHLANANRSILVTAKVLGNVRETRLEQLLNACAPTLVIESGSATDVNSVQ